MKFQHRIVRYDQYDKEIFVRRYYAVQYKPQWWPFWFEYSRYQDINSARKIIRMMRGAWSEEIIEEYAG